jgi:hypothetical protein
MFRVIQPLSLIISAVLAAVAGRNSSSSSTYECSVCNYEFAELLCHVFTWCTEAVVRSHTLHTSLHVHCSYM